VEPRRRILIAIGFVAVAIGGSIWVIAGDLNPPPGPVAPTMKTLSELSAEHVQLAGQITAVQSAIAALPSSSIKRVVRGVVTYTLDQYELTVSFSPPVDPAKSVVSLSDAVWVWGAYQYAQNVISTSTCLVSLTASTITVRIPPQSLLAANDDNWIVAYQIIEYN